MSNDHPLLAKQAALVIAHPGHELRLHGWLQQVHPWVGVLTDGSGQSSHSRLDSTTALLHEVGVQPSEAYGRFTDRAVYALLLAGDVRPFCSLVEELAEAFVARQVQYVVGDAAEGYNPVHDVCRLLIDAAVCFIETRGGPHIATFDFPLLDRPDVCPEERRSGAIWLHLEDGAFVRKRAAAATYTALAGEIGPLVAQLGEDVFRVECLRPVEPWSSCNTDELPGYERFGEVLVAAGYYQHVIRYREHLAPLADALRRFAFTQK
jgi:hypothetical protein